MAARKPPYSSAVALDSFFEKIRTLGDPGVVDAKWARAFGFEPALPASIPTTLRWLGVIDENGKTAADIWNRLRPPATRPDALAPLVKKAYDEIFGAVEVESATREVLEASFIHAYATGDVGRPLTCFLTLCRHAGIKTAVEPGRGSGARVVSSTNGRSGRSTRPKAPSTSPSQSETRRARVDLETTSSHSVQINLNVEIPATWTAEQIAERIKAIRANFD